PAEAPAPPPRPRLRVMIVGDESGRPFAAALAHYGNRFTVDDATRPGCPLVRSGWTRRFDGDAIRDTHGCARNLGDWLQRARTFKPDLVLVMNGVQDAADHAHAQPGRWEDAAL